MILASPYTIITGTCIPKLQTGCGCSFKELLLIQPHRPSSLTSIHTMICRNKVDPTPSQLLHLKVWKICSHPVIWGALFQDIYVIQSSHLLGNTSNSSAQCGADYGEAHGPFIIFSGASKSSG